MTVTVQFTAPFHLSKDGLTVTSYKTGQVEVLSSRLAELVINERVAEKLENKIELKAAPEFENKAEAELENKAEPAPKTRGRKK